MFFKIRYYLNAIHEVEYGLSVEAFVFKPLTANYNHETVFLQPAKILLLKRIIYT